MILSIRRNTSTHMVNITMNVTIREGTSVHINTTVSTSISTGFNAIMKMNVNMIMNMFIPRIFILNINASTN